MVLSSPEGASHLTERSPNIQAQATWAEPQAPTVIAVVVSFNPEKEFFVQLFDALLPQVAWAIVVDNASSTDVARLLDCATGCNYELLRIAENIGIAAAQNAGLKRAMERGADFALLLDQDSVPSATMVAELLTVIVSTRSCTKTPPVAAVGPARVDQRTQLKSFFTVRQTGMLRCWRPDPQSSNAIPLYVETDFLIASGTLIPLEVIRRIGGMRSNYFIDHVDREWCFRAKAAGYRLLGVPRSLIQHRIGDSIKQMKMRSSLKLSWHAPLRNYYLLRNALLMQRDVKVPLPWKIYFFFRLLRYAGGVLLITQRKRQRLHLMLLGVLHGLQGVSGRLDSATNRCARLPPSPLDPAA
jgi:rhamnosyltransferase